jgi:hypothetical protein
MALEPMGVTAEEPPNPELVDMSRRFRVSLSLAVPVLLLAMSEIIPGQPLERLISPQLSSWIQFALATPVVLWGGWPFFERAWRSLVTWRLNMFTLIGIGVGIAYVYSVAAVIAPHQFPDAFRAAGGTVAIYFEAAAVITTLVLLGQVLELRARSRTSAALRALLDLAPKMARRIDDSGVEHDVPLERIVAGDLIRVRPGEKVPVDGVVVDGILREEPGLGYVPIGFLERSSAGNATEVAGLPVLGHVSEAAKLRHVAQTVILTTPKSAPNGFGHMVRDLPFPRILMVPELTQFPSLWVSTRDLSGILALELPQNLLLRRNRAIKQISDYVLTIPLILLSLPILAVAALCIKMASRGRVFYAQEREGLGH